MKMQPLSNCQFEVQARDCSDGHLLRARFGPLTFTMTESEGLRLANAIADAIEQHRSRRDRQNGR